MQFRANIAVRATRRLVALLPPHLRRGSTRILGLLLLNSVLELLGLAMLVPVLASLLKDDPTQVPGLKWLYELVGPMSQSAFIVLLAGGALIVFIGKNIGTSLISRSLARFSFSIHEHFAEAGHRSLFAHGMQSLRARNSHEIARDINVATSQFAQLFVLPLLTFWNELILFVTIVAVVVAFEPTAALLLGAVVVPSSALFYRSVRRRVVDIDVGLHAQVARLNRDLHESVHGYTDVVLCGREQFFIDLYKRDVEIASRLSVQRYVLGLAPNRINEIAAVLGVCCLVAYGVHQFEDRSQLTFILGVFALTAFRTLPSLNRMLTAILMVRGQDHLLDVLESVEETDSELGAPEAAPLTFAEEVRLTNVMFTHRGAEHPTLRGVDLSVRRGECVGIVGPSGSGKTTLLNLMLRFFIEDEGAMYVDGVRLGHANTRAWRRLVGHVPQHVFLAEGTLRSNIAFGRAEADESQIRHAIRLANLETVIASLPEGLDTEVGEQGSRLSGGQRQRIAIARALYAGAEVLFFDEVTSALDPQTELEITRSMKELLAQGLTIIVVAHRVSTLRQCDRVLRLEDGVVAEETTFEELSRRQDNGA